MTTRVNATYLRRLVGASALLALLAACEPSTEKQVAELRPAVETVFGKLRSLAAVVSAAPPLETDAVTLGGATVRLDDDETRPNNALFIRDYELATPEAATTEGHGGTHAYDVEVCGEGITDDPASLPPGVPSFMARCARAEYALVLRTIDDHPATVIGSESFDPGHFTGEVLVFRLADAAPLGGFRVHAESSDQVSVEVDSSGNPIDPTERLNKDLSAEVFMVIQEGLRTHLPGSIDDE